MEVLAVWVALMATIGLLAYGMMKFNHIEPAVMAEPPVWSVEGLALALARGEITAEIFAKFADCLPASPNRDEKLAAALVNLHRSKPTARPVAVPPARRQSFRRWFRNLDAGNLIGIFGGLYLVIVTLTDTVPGQTMRITLGAMAYWSGLIDQTQAMDFALWSVKIAL